MSFWVLIIRGNQLVGDLSPEHVSEKNSAVSRDRHCLVSLSLFSLFLSFFSLLFTLIFFPSSFPLLFFPSFCFSLSPILTLFCPAPAVGKGPQDLPGQVRDPSL